MAKSKSFFGLRKGSTKTMTFSVLRGQQITKDRVTDVANPRTQAQMGQRIPFAQAVKFYKFAIQALFKFAFEDKKPVESDYNAFMRHNVARASSVAKPDYDNPAYPAIGNWMLSQGQLKPGAYGVSATAVSLDVMAATSDVTTIGGASSLILAEYPNLVAGDIVTFVGISTPLTASGLEDSESNVMQIRQFILDETDTTTLDSIGFNEVAEDSASLGCDLLNGGDYANAGAVIFSRNTPNGLLVSDAVVAGNTVWNNIIAGKQVPTAERADKYSWGATEQAILQGALAE